MTKIHKLEVCQAAIAKIAEIAKSENLKSSSWPLAFSS